MERNHSDFPLTLQAIARLEHALEVLDEKVRIHTEEKREMLNHLQQARLQNETLQETTQAVSNRLNMAIGRLQILLEE